jgi:hypothetical protein
MQKIFLSLAGLLAITAITPDASAIPSFARQASMTCKACHLQHVPILNGFGQAFKAGGYPMMGTQGKVEGERLSIPDTLNSSMLLKARYQKSNGATVDRISGDTTNSGQWQVPEEFSLYFGGRIAETIGFFFEGNASAQQLVAAFKLPAAVYIADAKLSVIPYMTDVQGASYGYEQSSTGAARNVSWAEHHRETSAQQYIGTDTAATGVAIVAQNDNGYINLSRWAPAFMGRKGGAQTLGSTYLRIAATPTVSTPARGDWSLHIGAQFWRGSNYAYDSLTPVTYTIPGPGPGTLIPLPGGPGPGLVPVDTRATALDFQASGQVGGKDLSVYATWAVSPAGTAAQPNILNADRLTRSVEPTLYRLNDRKAWTIGAEYSVIQNTLHIGAAYRSANTGGSAGLLAAGDNPTDNAVTLTAVYNMTQNIEFHLNHSMYNGSYYSTPEATTGNRLTTFMLEAAW